MLLQTSIFLHSCYKMWKLILVCMTITDLATYDNGEVKEDTNRKHTVKNTL
jgi:hypothetical protein